MRVEGVKIDKVAYSTCLYVWCLGLLLILASASSATGARVTGEEGVTPAVAVTEKAEEAAPRQISPAKASDKSSADGTPEREAVSGAEKSKTKTPVSEMKAENGKKGEEAQEESHVTIDFENVDIPVLVKFISELTGKNFVIDKAVRGKVTIMSPTKISVDEAYKVFESVLEVHGYTAIPAGNIVKIVPAVEARSKNVETLLEEEAKGPEDKVVTQLIPLRYANPDELKKLFAPMISKSSVMVSYPPARTLIVTDVLSNIQRIFRITKAIDVEGVGEEISVIPLKSATAMTLAKSLSTVFQRGARRAKAGGPEESDVRVVADERTNSLIVLASEEESRKIKQLVALLDREPMKGEGDIRVYYLKHANAEDLTKVLSSLPSEKSTKTAQGKAPVISKEARIVADKATNSLVITADKDDYRVLEGVIEKLDIPRMMVYIEALIMEVNVNKNFELGVEWEGVKTFSYDGKDGGVFGGSSGSGFSTIKGILSDNPALPTGFSLGVIGEAIEIGGIKFPNLAAVLHAYQSDQDVHILSTPQILTTDNEEAEITVGKNVPYVVRQETSQAELDYSSYEYKDVGVTLKITPQISQNRLVRLNIYQEVTRLIETEGLKEGRPTTYKRLAQTTVIVADANTVVIGGLIGDDTTNTHYQVPCLANIPGLGWFFRSEYKKREKTNLFVFLTPHIIQNPSESRDIYHEKKDQIERIKEGVIKMYGKEPAPARSNPQPATRNE
ncbi:MAG: type II secretion system secretin GspD [Deltaproteobacteria bacterium]|nr:type II secretion system secretin GspD [Deltaproteobacteria bacterium]